MESTVYEILVVRTVTGYRQAAGEATGCPVRATLSPERLELAVRGSNLPIVDH